MQASSVSSRFEMRSALPETGTKLDARSRMAVSLLMSAVTICVGSVEGQSVLLAASFLYVLSLRRWKAVAIAYAFLAVMMSIAVLFTYGISQLTPTMPFSPRGIAVPFMRSAEMMNVVLPLALTCRVQELLTALKGLRLPFCIYIPAAVMIRFIPTFMHDIRQVAETLKIRGYSLTFGEMFRHPLMMLRLMFTPLLFRSLRTSEELGMAAELKGLEAGSHFIPFRTQRWAGGDTALILLSLAVAALALYIHSEFGVVPVRGMR